MHLRLNACPNTSTSNPAQIILPAISRNKGPQFGHHLSIISTPAASVKMQPMRERKTELYPQITFSFSSFGHEIPLIGPWCQSFGREEKERDVFKASHVLLKSKPQESSVLKNSTQTGQKRESVENIPTL